MTGDRSTYDTIIDKFDSFFQVRRNVIIERAQFSLRVQHADETAEQYIMVLHNLAARCNYRELEAEMIRDRLVVGIRNSSLSERLQLNPDLTLQKAKLAIRQSEAVHEQQWTLREPTDVDTIRHSSDGRSRSRGNAGD